MSHFDKSRQRSMCVLNQVRFPSIILTESPSIIVIVAVTVVRTLPLERADADCHRQEARYRNARSMVSIGCDLGGRCFSYLPGWEGEGRQWARRYDHHGWRSHVTPYHRDSAMDKSSWLVASSESMK
jgi:hypothetical protein